MDQVKDEIEKLTALILEYDHSYYVLNDPLVSDAIYDQMFFRLKDLTEKHPDLIPPQCPIYRVAGKVADGFKTMTHLTPMRSIKTSTNYTNQTAFDFMRDMRKALGRPDVMVLAEPKFDGLALNNIYIDGVLTVSGTRGDGLNGEDVTNNARTIRQIPLMLQSGFPKRVEVRGEVILTKSALKAYNDNPKNKKKLSNTRNGASGLLRQHDPKITANARLSFYAYAIGAWDGDNKPLTQCAVLDWLRGNGFNVFGPAQPTFMEDLLAKQWETFYNSRDLFDFDIDGVVYKVIDLESQEKLGYRNREPKWAIAHKFPPMEAVTLLESIRMQVGRTGVITPVGIVSPVKVGGVVVTRVNLHNEDYILTNQIHIGDKIIIRRAGDVVPEFVGVFETKDELSPFKMITHCPCCGSVLKKVLADYYCGNKYHCKEAVTAWLSHFASKQVIDIEDLGERLIEQLVGRDVVKTPLDIYRLTKTALLSFDKVGKLKAEKILYNIEKSKKTQLYRFIFGLGIANIGEVASKVIAKRFKTISGFMGATYHDLIAIDGIGKEMATAVVSYLSEDDNLSLINGLLKVGFDIQPESETGTKLAGLTFVITGTLPTLKRHDVEELIEKLGGKVSDSVSKKTSYVIAGENAGTKLITANTLGTTILDEAAFLKLIQ